ncbi:DNA-deoxyinosine glycosylase [Alishewanella sp. d11]|uniref:DNA-deoxyinosine glycosylase n=1 Tax=Alishewanella sp. d11 TaxID=3414030 RepID=UPI003BF8023D
MLKPLQSLAPVVNTDARVLILGSMPGAASLAQQQYYAHPRNAFWPIMASLYGFAADLPYAIRLQQLTAQGVALWDVLAHCERQGSLDSAIRNEQANDFDSFFATYPHIHVIAFNGGKALQSFQKHVKSHLVRPIPHLLALPSTSPAYAAMPFSQKLQLWQQITGNLSL